MTTDLTALNEQAKAMLDSFGDDPQNPDKLHPDLRPYYEPKGGTLGWPMLRSPLVYSIPFMSWKMANTQYEAKKQRVDELEEEGNYASAIWYYEKPYRMTYLMMWYEWGVISKAELAKILPDVWTDTEHPRQFGYRKLVKLFKEAGYVTDAPDHHPPEEPIIFRGCLPKDMKGLSWTFNPRKADWFANRFNRKGTGKVYQARIPAKAVLGIFLGRDEDEVVVDPKYLIDIQEMTA